MKSSTMGFMLMTFGKPTPPGTSRYFLRILLLPRYFHTTTKFIDQAVSSGGLVVVNCVMGWSRWLIAVLARVTLPVLARSATCVAAYLMIDEIQHSLLCSELLQ